MDLSPHSYIQIFKVTGSSILEKNIFTESFFLLWVWWPSWSVYADPMNKHSFPTETPYEIVTDQVVEKNIFDDGRRTDDGDCQYYKFTN